MLVACFSHSGNTRILAEAVATAARAPLWPIRPGKSYPSVYDEVVEVARIEQRKNARPSLVDDAPRFAKGSMLFVGYPNWWSTMPMPVFTFLEGCDLSGVTIAPFCTHEGSGLGRSVEDIRRICPRSKVLRGLAVRGSRAGLAESAVEDWIKGIGLRQGSLR